jgi:nitroreductase
MVRRFDQRPVPEHVIDDILDTARRAPSAGFAQGLEFLVLDMPEHVAAFWEISRDPEFGWELDDVANGPTVIVIPLPDAECYLERYSQPDKIGFGLDQASNWPVKFWDIDAAMASMLVLLAAVDAGLGGWFFGITHGERELLDRFDVPERLTPIGYIGLGYKAEDEEPSGSWTRRRRRPLAEQIHRNGW